MKYLNKAIIGLLAAAAATGFYACQDDFSGREPSFEAPVAKHQANMTLSELKDMYWDTESNYCDTIGLIYNDVDDITGNVVKYPRNADGTRKALAEDVYIKGRVCSSDFDGNMFKKLMVQDEQGNTVAFSIDAYSLYLNYRYGQEIVFRATGMGFGAYAGQHVIGVPQWYDRDQVWETGRMPLEYFKDRVELNGWPEPSKVYVTDLDLSAVADYNSNLKTYENRLARFSNVYFPEANGKTQLGRYQVSSTLREVASEAGGSINLNTSGYSTFWYELVPEGEVSITAVMLYSTSAKGLELCLNTFDGIDTDPEAVKGSSPDSAYSIDEVIELEAAGTTASGWLTGYIVGAVAPEVEGTITSNDDIEWTADATLPGTVVIAPTPDVTDVASCIIVPLPQGSKLREAVNLVDHPGNYGKQLWVNGAFVLYMQAWGVNCAGAAADFVLEGLEPDKPVTAGDGSEENPYSCAQIIAMNPQSTTEAVEAGIWAKGYIVGYYENYEPHFEVSTTQAANILLADSPDVTDVSKCICIQLTYGTAPRELNLKDAPGNLGRLVQIKGDVMKYNTLPGLKNTTEYKWDGDDSGNGGGNDNPNPPAGDGNGTLDNPYTCAQVIAMNPQSTTDAVATGVWAQGYIVGYFENYEAHFGLPEKQAANILLSDNASASSAAECICIQLTYGTAPRDLNLVDAPGNLGKQLKIKGDVMKYNTLPGLKNTTEYELDGQSGGGGNDTPNPPAGNVVYSGLVNDMNGWTIDNYDIPAALTDVWTWKVYNGAGYLNGSAYMTKAYAAEAYVYTTLDLTAYKKAAASFEHAAKFQTTLQQLCGMVVRVAGTSEWIKLTIPTWPTAGAWTFAASGSVDLSAYAGKKIEVGFLYKSTADGADTWEIRKFEVTAE